MKELDKEFVDKGILQGRTYVFRGEDALAIIEKCRQMKKMIYGIDAFRITDQITQIVDYTDYTNRAYQSFNDSQYYAKYHVKKNADSGHWEEAIHFVKDRMNAGYFFEIVHE